MTSTRRALSILALLALAGCGLPAPDDGGPALAELYLDGPLSESGEEGLFGSGLAPTHHALLSYLDAAATDDDVAGLLLRVGSFEGSWARVREIGEALARVREAKKPVHCHFDTSDNAGYVLLASACDRISMGPAGMLDLVGVSAETMYAHQLLETLGLQADLMQVGRFKGAADTFTRDEMPPETRQTLDALLDDLHGVMTSALVDGRHVERARVQALLDAGPYTAHRALEAGLIDDVAYDDEARAHAKQAAKVERVVDDPLAEEREHISLVDLVRALSGGHEKREGKGRHLVLAYLDGTISEGSRHQTRSAHAEPFVAMMRRVANDDDAAAVVLRIDSPGGSALASDRMWHAARRVAKRKPLIVSVGEMAASGGYYVASAADEILAHDESLVGSIGVVGGKIVAEGLRERAGVTVTRLKRGERAGWLSAARAFTPAERDAMQGLLQRTYRLFLRRVAEGRSMTLEQLQPVAEGRLLTGRRAIEGGLVDRRGGLHEALATARERGGLDEDAEVRTWPGRRSFLDDLAEVTGGGQASLMREPLARFAGAQRFPLAELLLRGDAITGATALPFSVVFR
jgi:protease-4